MSVSKKPFFFILLLSTLAAFSCLSQELPAIKNFYPTDYNGENQNWAVSQDADKLIYVANSKGLLEFNGAYWKQYLSPNESIMRSVKVVDDLIYTGCYMEFGYWKKNQLQTLTYTSISQQLKVDLIEDEEFWNILNLDDWMVFQSLKRIYIYNVEDKSVQYIDSDSKITKIFEVDGEIYFQILGEGIFKINGGKAVLFLNDNIVKQNEIINIFGSTRDLMILTKKNGFYRYRDNMVLKSDAAANKVLSEVSTYCAIRLDDGGYALGTIANGLFVLNDKGDIRSQINLAQGLTNNTVLALHEDVSNNIWLGLDNGISFVNTDPRYELHNENNGVLGSVYASVIHDGNLYLGTNQGLYYRKSKSRNNFNLIDGTQGQVWCLKVIDDMLLCGHDSGTFSVSGGQVKKISNIPGTWKIARVDNNRNFLLQGNYDGLYILKRSQNDWKLRNKLGGFNNSSRYFETLGNEIFVNHEYKGIFKLEIDSSYTKIKKVSIDTDLKGSDSGIAKYNGELLYAYKKGIFKYVATDRKFIKDSLLSKAYTPEDYESGKLIVNEKENALWIFTKSKIIYITPTGLADTQRILNIPLTSKNRKGIIGYENISNVDKNEYLIGTTSGYTIVDIKKEGIKDFSVSIDQIRNGTNKSVDVFQSIAEKGEYDVRQNNFAISFYSPEFNRHVGTQYQFQLLGIYDDWSQWSENSTALFENLPYGDYIFNVRAKIGDIISTNVSSYAFEIAKPWYISTAMLYLYAIGILATLLLTHTLYKRFYRKQRLALVAKNERELNFAHLQNERELIKIKNEKLRTDFSGKSKELAASLMSIAKKNDLLRNIKDKLRTARGEDAIKSVVNTINKSLRENDEWKFFQEAFNNADSEFLKNLKGLHPVLTPSDLKLCAYLRLNLSTKEMSDLLNITPRSVEIKRYRLRKKLNLQHEDNLVTYILGL